MSFTIATETPEGFPDYELIDCGDFEKLERFGKYITIRPEPQAVWAKQLPESEWERLHHIRFKPRSNNSGDWIRNKKDMPDRWHIQYVKGDLKLKLRLGLTAFKHVGVFPEQAANWDYIFQSLRKMKTPQPRFLNLFAYTGAASLAARAAGAEVTHVDSIKQVITWAKENMELSGLDNIRWMVEDAAKFVKREIKRGKTYNGIILDPPAYGHGPNGEKWKLEEHIYDMIKDVTQLLDEKEYFLILNTYSLGFSSIIVENLLKSTFKDPKDLQIGELYLQATSGYKLPLGVYGKMRL